MARALFFVGYDDAAGGELWRSDGSLAGTRRVKDIKPGPDWSFTIALARAPVNACPSLDTTGDGRVTIDEIIVAVDQALKGCA